MSKEYSEGLCSCFSHLGSCCYVFWCSPCAVGELYGAMNGEESPCVSSKCALVVIGSFFVPFVGCVCAMMTRQQLQREYGVENESGVKVCCLAWCCHCCAVSQDRAEYMVQKGEPKLFGF